MPRLLAGGLALCLAAGVTVVVHHALVVRSRERAHDRLVAQEHGYLDGVRRLAADVRRDAAPVEAVLDALATPATGDIFAARDALANDAAERALHDDLAGLHRLSVPRPWHPYSADLSRALGDMHDAVAAMRERRGIDNPDDLNTYLQATDGAAFFSAIVAWRQAIGELYAEGRQVAPAAPSSADDRAQRASLITWVFGAERSCIAANIAFGRVEHKITGDTPDLHAYRYVGRLLLHTAGRLRALAVPAGAADLREHVVSRLDVLVSTGRAIVDLADAAAARNRFDTRAALDRLLTSLSAARGLAGGFRHVHALACAAMTAPDRGRPPGGAAVPA